MKQVHKDEDSNTLFHLIDSLRYIAYQYIQGQACQILKLSAHVRLALLQIYVLLLLDTS